MILVHTTSYLMKPRQVGSRVMWAKRLGQLHATVRSQRLRLNFKNIQWRSPKDNSVMEDHAGTGKCTVIAVAMKTMKHRFLPATTARTNFPNNSPIRIA